MVDSDALLDEALEIALGRLLREAGLSLATAESCTGGLIGHRITNVPGSSDYYLGGAIAYAYSAKERLLGVSPHTLQTYGAVSEETAREMARGVRRALAADLGVSVTGIAGPGGGMPGKPVGLVYIALSAPDMEACDRYVWPGDRETNKRLSSEAALGMVVDYLRDRLAGATEG